MKIQALNIYNILNMTNKEFIFEIEDYMIRYDDINYLNYSNSSKYYRDIFKNDYVTILNNLTELPEKNISNFYCISIEKNINSIRKKLKESFNLHKEMIQTFYYKETFLYDAAIWGVKYETIEEKEKELYRKLDLNYSDNELIPIFFGQILNSFMIEFEKFSCLINDLLVSFKTSIIRPLRLSIPNNIILPVLIFCIKIGVLKDENGLVLNATIASGLLNEHFLFEKKINENYTIGSFRKRLSIKFADHLLDNRFLLVHTYLGQVFGIKADKKK